MREYQAVLFAVLRVIREGKPHNVIACHRTLLIMPKRTERDPAEVRRELEALELLPRKMATRRTDDLLRNLLGSAPDPRAAPKMPPKTTKRAK